MKLKITIMTFVATFQLNAMVLVKERDDSLVNLRLSGEQEVSCERWIAEHSQTIQSLLQSAQDVEHIPLPRLSKHAWNAIYELLKKCYPAEGAEPEERAAIELIYRKLSKVPSSQYVDLINAVDYLEIPLLFSLMMRNYDWEDLRVADLRRLTPGARCALIENYCANMVGPLPHKLIAVTFEESAREFTGEFMTKHCMSEQYVAIAVNLEHDPQLKPIIIWNLNTGQKMSTCLGHTDSVIRMWISGDRLISSSADHTVRVWNIPTGENIFVWNAHTAPVVALSVENNNVIAGAANGRVCVWDSVSGRLLNTFQSDDHVCKIL